MRQQALRTVTLLGLFVTLAAVSARAQAYTDERAVMDIPFDFTVGETRLKAGTYVIGDTPTTLLLRSKDGRQSVMVLPLRTRPKGKLTSSQLVFRRYGESYFLSEAWMFAAGLGYELRPSRAEREVAKNSAGPRKVTLIARR